MSTKVVTGRVRFSYANVFEPRAMTEGQEEKYSVSILIPKSDKATISRINEAIREAFDAKFGSKKPAKWKNPLRDGDDERPDDEAYEGHFFINANSKNKPGIVDSDLQPIMGQDEFYSGCYGRASITLFGYDTSGNKGVGVGLNNLQKLEDGVRLSGGSSASEDFCSNDDLM